MLNKSEAESLVNNKLRQMETPEFPFAVVEDATLEKHFGWIFFYNTKRYIETKEIIYHLAGNAPIFVNKVTGTLTSIGTNKPLRVQIEEFERDYINL